MTEITGSSGTMVLLMVGVIIAWVVFFSLLWTGIVYFMAWFGGWQKMARVYSASGPRPEGLSFPSVTGTVGLANYRRVLSVVVTDSGLYISVWRIFQFGHPPLFLPWDALHGIEISSLFFRSYYYFEVGSPRLARMRLPVRILEGTPVSLMPGRR